MAWTSSRSRSRKAPDAGLGGRPRHLGARARRGSRRPQGCRRPPGAVTARAAHAPVTARPGCRARASLPTEEAASRGPVAAQGSGAPSTVRTPAGSPAATGAPVRGGQRALPATGRGSSTHFFGILAGIVMRGRRPAGRRRRRDAEGPSPDPRHRPHPPLGTWTAPQRQPAPSDSRSRHPPRTGLQRARRILIQRACISHVRLRLAGLTAGPRCPVIGFRGSC